MDCGTPEEIRRAEVLNPSPNPVAAPPPEFSTVSLPNDTHLTPAPFYTRSFHPAFSQELRSFLNVFLMEQEEKQKYYQALAPITSDRRVGWFNYYKYLKIAAQDGRWTDSEKHIDMTLLQLEASRALRWLRKFASKIFIVEPKDADLVIALSASGFRRELVVPMQVDDGEFCTIHKKLKAAELDYVAQWVVVAPQWLDVPLYH